MKALIIYFVVFLIIKFIRSLFKKLWDVGEERAKEYQAKNNQMSDEEFIGEYIETAPENDGTEENANAQSDTPSKVIIEVQKPEPPAKVEATATPVEATAAEEDTPTAPQGNSLAELIRKIQLSQQSQRYRKAQPAQTVQMAGPTSRTFGQSEDRPTPTSPQPTNQEEWSIHSIEEARRAIIWGEILKPKF